MESYETVRHQLNIQKNFLLRSVKTLYLPLDSVFSKINPNMYKIGSCFVFQLKEAGLRHIVTHPGAQRK